MNKRRRRTSRRKNNHFLRILVILVLINIVLLMVNFFKMKNALDIENIFNNILPSFDISIWKDKEVDDEKSLVKNIEEVDEFQKSDDYIIKKLEEYENLIIVKDSFGISSIENIPKPLNIEKLKVDKEKDYVLIYHTHGTEAFLSDDESKYYDEDINKNVIAIGDVLSTVLEAKGHKTDHSTVIHDLPSFSKSYSRSLNTINNKKEENSNIKVIFDIHRDGVNKDASYKERFLETARVNINGVSTATFSLVVGPDTPNYDEVLSFAKYIKAVSDSIYPGLCSGIIVKPSGKFNLYSSNYSSLIEIGSNLVTLEESKECARLVGSILSLVLDSIIE